jgi:hypothetical protein
MYQQVSESESVRIRPAAMLTHSCCVQSGQHFFADAEHDTIGSCGGHCYVCEEQHKLEKPAESFAACQVINTIKMLFFFWLLICCYNFYYYYYYYSSSSSSS